MRTIEVPTDIFPEFELRDTVVDLQRGRKERKAREGEEAQQQKEEEVRRKEAKAEELHLQKEGHPEKRPRTERSDTKTEAAGGEAGPSQSRFKKGHMANVYHTDSDKEAVVDFVKDSKELYDNIDEHVEEKARKEFLWEQFAKSRKLSVKVCKTWFDSQRTRYGKLTQLKSGQAHRR